MVTLDRVVEDVKDFNGDIARSNKDNERSAQGLKILNPWMDSFEETLKERTGYSKMNMPRRGETKKTVINLGDVEFLVSTSKRTKRPAYKEAVLRMEDYLIGIENLLSEGRAITGVLKREEKTYVSVDSLITQYEIIVAGVMQPELKHAITYKTGILDEKIPESIDLKGKNPYRLTPRNAETYINLDRLKDRLKNFKEKYEAAITDKGEEVVKATNKIAYKSKEKEAAGPNWAYVVKTMISSQNLGELNMLGNPETSFRQKRRVFENYDLLEKETRGIPTLYVSTFSVYDRIQALKAEKEITRNRYDVKSEVIV